MLEKRQTRSIGSSESVICPPKERRKNRDMSRDIGRERSREKSKEKNDKRYDLYYKTVIRKFRRWFQTEFDEAFPDIKKIRRDIRPKYLVSSVFEYCQLKFGQKTCYEVFPVV